MRFNHFNHKPIQTTSNISHLRLESSTAAVHRSRTDLLSKPEAWLIAVKCKDVLVAAWLLDGRLMFTSILGMNGILETKSLASHNRAHEWSSSMQDVGSDASLILNDHSLFWNCWFVITVPQKNSYRNRNHWFHFTWTLSAPFLPGQWSWPVRSSLCSPRPPPSLSAPAARRRCAPQRPCSPPRGWWDGAAACGARCPAWLFG